MAKIAYPKDDYDQMREGGFVVLDPGVYDMEIVGVEESVSDSPNTRGQTKWQVKCQVIDSGEYGGVPFSIWLYPESKARWKVAELQKAVGVDPEDLGDRVGIDTADWIGHVISVEVGKRIYDGKERNEVGTIYASESDPGAAGAARRKSELKSEAGDLDDSDIPF